MDFKISVNGEVRVFEQYKDALRFLDNKLAHWNNFGSHKSLDIKISKVPSKTDTIGVNASDNFNLSERIS